MTLMALDSDYRISLNAHAIAIPALSSHVRPALVLAEAETRSLLQVAGQYDVRRGGRFAAGPAGIQLWSAPFDGERGGQGNAVLLGSVDWQYDTPVRHYATVYRSIVTAAGVAAGQTTETVLRAVLGLADIPLGGSHITMPAPPPRDPFRSKALLA